MKSIVAACTVMALWACKPVPVYEALKDLQGEKYMRRLEAGQHRIKLRYIPGTLRLLSRQGLDSSRTVDRSLLDSLQKTETSIEGLSFILRLEPKDSAVGMGLEHDVVYGGLAGFGSYQEASQTYMFGLGQKIWLELDGKKQSLSQYHMENSWGMNPGRSFYLVFKLPAGKKPGDPLSFRLVLDDIVPGLSRKKVEWKLPLGKYDGLI